MFYLAFPAVTCTNLAAGIILIFTASYIINKIRKASKSPFAYTLAAFTFLDGAQFLAFFFIQTIRHPIYYSGQVNYAVN
jgi:hypothetical protein